MIIRTEVPADHRAVFDVQARAFGRTEEAELVDVLRPIAQPQISLVAESGARVVGHIFFSPVFIDGTESWIALGLAPLAVAPEFQNRGIGSELVRAGLRACGGVGHALVFVLGHTNYYPRFGFQSARVHGLRYEQALPDEDAFMVIELSPGALAGRTGVVRYLPEFSRV